MADDEAKARAVEVALDGTVHILTGGLACCGIGPPAKWPPSYRWVRPQEKGEATCQDCVAWWNRHGGHVGP